MTTEKIIIRKTKDQINITVGATTVDISDIAIHIHSSKKLTVSYSDSIVTDHYMIVWF